MKNPLHFDLLKGVDLTHSCLHCLIFFAFHIVVLPRFGWPNKQTKNVQTLAVSAGTDHHCITTSKSHVGQLRINFAKREHL